MASINLIESFTEFKEAENIDRPTLMKVLEDVFKTLLRKKYGSDENFDVIVNTEKGDLEILRRRTIVTDGEVEDDNAQIAYSEAIKVEPDYQVGEDLYEEVEIQDFGRRAILAAKQTLSARIGDLKKNILVKKYADKEGEIINGEVYQVWKKEVLLLDDEGNELILPKTEQIPTDYFKKGENIKAVVKKVELKNNAPLIVLSRTSPLFLAKLLEIEVPEIFDGLIVIKKIVREPGERAKVAVESYDDRIDPVGACVGMKGSRIHGIVRELRNENIDIINYTSNIQLLIQRALTPARISRMDIDQERKYASVYLMPDQVSLAIGKKGVNIKLACELTGFEIDVFRDEVQEQSEFDIDLEEFSDEIEEWIIDELKRIGCDTARSVLELTPEELVRRSDLEVETVEDVRKILQEEFEKE
ncbi:NusA antitermination factor [Chitinophaga costaii]|uniref:Transcription termination/antitermination protein NusA n=1 Tax=Chitinophaga costaii TaxID=1335309 RepID=A0A1C4AL82_9BACT|nr:transcription termination factor NusA [Chitinophaga costaii]PUZ26655.1 transcription termination/antitermination protein NusA [Chitinophaga costaii]SCB95442.1 NusA antitermination factor [Chitinophaga costaii]